MPRAVSSESGVEQWKLVGLITRRSSVRIRPPQPPLLALYVSFPSARVKLIALELAL